MQKHIFRSKFRLLFKVNYQQIFDTIDSLAFEIFFRFGIIFEIMRFNQIVCMNCEINYKNWSHTRLKP
jgi:hypothetical protein